MSVEQLFEQLWQDYTQRLCPSALKVQKLLTHKHEQPVNDHIALRTFSGSKLGLAQLAKHFVQLGYQQAGEYHFESKKLLAHHYQHPEPQYPKVFISELCLELCSDNLKDIVGKLIHDLPHQYADDVRFLFQGRPWRISKQEYLSLAQESEYAAWVGAHGFGANHFTVSVNELSGFADLEQVNDFLVWHHFEMNHSGGDIKGSAEVGLQQSSTIADKVSVEFSDGELEIPGGFYEFAKRFPMKNGELYQGFVTASADKIFESTNRGS
ncbi:DUF1338 domain-containing protein [Vibrio gangliei]|uniref:DUF1338 domain-containing protein n=1 Tax=Vibrio gangliei TaxID=2077090 RepID=UPI001475EE9D|nr:DUF1338 domain-containing protein [Vibrio gangliei]